jgi:hypothetical protein
MSKWRVALVCLLLLDVAISCRVLASDKGPAAVSCLASLMQ